MSRLFELYVYNKLYQTYQDNILFQVSGYQKATVDFIHIGERLIIDAKYKPQYDEKHYVEISDIREISGYSRDCSILDHFGADFVESGEEAKCLIIYPQNIPTDLGDENDNNRMGLQEINSINEFHATKSSLWEQASPIRYYRNFRKLKLSLPII